MYRARNLTWIVLALALAAPRLSAESTRIEGVVRDATGAVVAGAAVSLQASGEKVTTATNDAGQFSFSNVGAASGTVTVSRTGFDSAHSTWKQGELPGDGHVIHLEIIVRPAAAREEVIVSSSRT